MPTIAAITRERHLNKRWKRYTNYKFATGHAVAPLVLNELPRAALAMPIAFTMQGDALIPVAMLGLAPHQNLMVDEKGRWTGPYIPAVYRSYPFLLAPHEGHDVMCIDEDSGLVTQGAEGELFFNDTGGPSAPLADMLTFLNQVNTSRKATLQVCAVLKQHGLIQPWPITYPTAAGEQRVDGLSRIDEVALNALPSEAFLEVRAAGGLAVAYCQLLSMQNFPTLAQVAAAQAEAGARQLPVNEKGELDLEFLNENPLLDFSRLK